MTELNKKSVNVVVLGRQNPQILNIDFLKSNEIITVTESPFKELFEKEKPFDKFVSTPVFTNLVLGPIEFVVDERRFSIRDKTIDDWVDTSIFDIALRYFETLRYTPINIIGINFTSEIAFSKIEEQKRFQELFLVEKSTILKIVDNDNVNASIVLRYPYPNDRGRVTLSINPYSEKQSSRIINCNYEFDCNDVEILKELIGKISEKAEYFDKILNDVLERI